MENIHNFCKVVFSFSCLFVYLDSGFSGVRGRSALHRSVTDTVCSVCNLRCSAACSCCVAPARWRRRRRRGWRGSPSLRRTRPGHSGRGTQTTTRPPGYLWLMENKQKTRRQVLTLCTVGHPVWLAVFNRIQELYCCWRERRRGWEDDESTGIIQSLRQIPFPLQCTVSKNENISCLF